MCPKWLVGLFLFAYFGNSFDSALAADYSFRFDPHAFSSTLRTEPAKQAVGLMKATINQLHGQTPWEIAFHFESETMGRRDVSLDLDRAYIKLPLSLETSQRSVLYLGRLHPFLVSQHPDYQRPWNLLAQEQTLNQGVLLGYGYGPESLEPLPLLQGWVGAQFWSDGNHKKRIQWGFSLSPLFIPGQGSEVIFSETGAAETGRFARRPPDKLVLQENEHPLTFSVDKSQAWKNIFLKPQAMLQVLFNSNEDFPRSQTWLTLSRAPSPEPTFRTEESIQVREDSLSIHARLSPRFEQRTGLSVTHLLHFSFFDTPHSLTTSLTGSDDRFWGYDVGIHSPYWSLSFLDKNLFAPQQSEFVSTAAVYAHSLIQADLKIPFSGLTFFGGVKHHLHQSKDLWWRTGLSVPLDKAIELGAGIDIFSGDPGSFFGEWRNNDRAYAVIRWEVGT